MNEPVFLVTCRKCYQDFVCFGKLKSKTCKRCQKRVIDETSVKSLARLPEIFQEIGRLTCQMERCRNPKGKQYIRLQNERDKLGDEASELMGKLHRRLLIAEGSV